MEALGTMDLQGWAGASDYGSKRLTCLRALEYCFAKTVRMGIAENRKCENKYMKPMTPEL